MTKYIIVYVFSVFISSVSQIFLKKSAEKKHNSMLHEYVNLYVLIGYVMLIASSLMSIYALKVVPLSKGPIVEALGYIFVSVMGALFLNERIEKKAYVGITLIIIGIVISCI